MTEGGPSAGHGGQAAAARAPEAGAGAGGGGGGGNPFTPRRPAARRHHLGSPAPDRRREPPGTARCPMGARLVGAWRAAVPGGPGCGT